jgi:hypothetical protein
VAVSNWGASSLAAETSGFAYSGTANRSGISQLESKTGIHSISIETLFSARLAMDRIRRSRFDGIALA